MSKRRAIAHDAVAVRSADDSSEVSASALRQATAPAIVQAAAPNCIAIAIYLSDTPNAQ